MLNGWGCLAMDQDLPTVAFGVSLRQPHVVLPSEISQYYLITPPFEIDYLACKNNVITIPLLWNLLFSLSCAFTYFPQCRLQTSGKKRCQYSYVYRFCKCKKKIIFPKILWQAKVFKSANYLQRASYFSPLKNVFFNQSQQLQIRMQCLS